MHRTLSNNPIQASTSSHKLAAEILRTFVTTPGASPDLPPAGIPAPDETCHTGDGEARGGDSAPWQGVSLARWVRCHTASY